jgi:uncharacterized protein
MPYLILLLSGALFGAGVTLSGMVNPMKVLNFMDISGAWDPTLIFVMGGGLLTTLIGFRIVLGRSRPWFAGSFNLPRAAGIDGRLIGGAALFGAGWGMAGFCPGPAVASLIFGYPESYLFVAAMAAGIIAARLAGRRPETAIQES